MANDTDIGPAVERRLKWDELRVRIEHYKYYLSRALHVTIFFYAITGGVLGIYLKDAGASAREQVRFFLLLPILIGAVLGGVFIYGARLQERAVDSMEHIREELRERLGLDVEELYDAQLLNILLRIFGYIYFFVAGMLVIVPPLTGAPRSITFYIGAIACLLLGISLPVLAHRIDKRLKVRRVNRMLWKLESWHLTAEQMVDMSNLQGTDFYYQLRERFPKKTIEDVDKCGDSIKIFLEGEIETLEKRGAKRKSHNGWLVRAWYWWTSA